MACKAIVARIEAEFENYRNDVLVKEQKKARLMTSCARNAVSFGVGNIIPGVSEVFSTIEDFKTRKMSWTGFVASIE